MELRDFVSETLTQIIAGVAEAQRSASEFRGVVNPIGLSFRAVEGHGYDGNHNIAQIVEFDVAVAATEGKSERGGIGIVVGSFALGGQQRLDKGSSFDNRIRFTVPVLLPPGSLEA